MSQVRAVRATDAVIIVMGVTGSGKSTFINELLPPGIPPMKVGVTLTSCTTTVDHRIVDRFELPSTTIKGIRGRRSVVLVEMPGFDQEEQADSAALDAMARWAQTHVPGDGCPAGVVILHDVNTHFERRMADAYVAFLRKHFNMAVVASKVDRVSEEKAESVRKNLADKWGESSRNSRDIEFHKFQEQKVRAVREAQEARDILGRLLSQVKVGDRGLCSVFTELAEARRKMERKQKSGLRKFIRSITRLFGK